MRKKIGIGLLIFSAVALAAPAQTWLTDSFDDALAKAKAQGKMLLVDFYAESG